MMGLFKSRKFCLMLVDLVLSLVGFFVTKYVDPAAAEDVMFVIGALQPVVISVIVGITVEDAAALKAGTHVSQQSK